MEKIADTSGEGNLKAPQNTKPGEGLLDAVLELLKLPDPSVCGGCGWQHPVGECGPEHTSWGN